MIVNAETGEVRWSIVWGAFHSALRVHHESTLYDDPADLLEGLLVIRNELMRPAGEIVAEMQAGEANGGAGS